MLKEKYADEIAAILARYPTKNSAVIPLSISRRTSTAI